MKKLVPLLVLSLVAVGLTFSVTACEQKKEEEKKEETKKEGEGEPAADEDTAAAENTDTAAEPAADTTTAAAEDTASGGEEEAAEYIKFNIDHHDTSKGPVDGQFTSFELKSAVVDLENLENSTATYAIDVASVETGIPDRDKHLKTPDFFDAPQFSTIAFTIKDIQPEVDGKHKATAEIGIKGLSKDVPIEFAIVEKNDDGSIVVEGSAKLSRSELSVGGAPEASGAADELTLSARLKVMNM